MGGVGVTAPAPLLLLQGCKFSLSISKLHSRMVSAEEIRQGERLNLQSNIMSKRKPNPIVDPNSYEPLGDYIILEPQQEEAITEGGIHIPEQARSYLNEGKVVKTGPDVSPNISKGKFVTFEASSEFRLKMAKDLILFVVKESSLILIREDKVSKLFPELPPARYLCAQHQYEADIPCPKCSAEFQKNFGTK